MKRQTVRSNGFTVIELLIVLTIIGILASAFVGAKGGCTMINFSHGTGEKVGQVVKFSKQGFIRDTWEGQLIRGGFSDGSGVFGTQPFDFTVEGDALAKKVQEYMRDRTEVRVGYRIEGIYSPFRSESHGHFLTAIEPLKPEKTQ